MSAYTTTNSPTREEKNMKKRTKKRDTYEGKRVREGEEEKRRGKIKNRGREKEKEMKCEQRRRHLLQRRRKPG